jgi:predicted nucleotidyltransferase
MHRQDLDAVVDHICRIGGDGVRFVILYGSRVEERQTPLSDIDIAVYYHAPAEERFQFRMKASGSLGDAYDIHVFQDLPLHVRKDIISHGDVLYQKDYVETFNIFLQTIREYEDFKPRLDIYYEGLRG